ncbi:MAG: hypothetical protein EPO21_00650 [Chloroflexota bacterium]|nr:MAG: hypothetical protein EPO21_00650 [Chloroflexota bacterium]
MYRLSGDRNKYTLSFDYQGDFVPSPVEVTIYDDSTTLAEIAEKIYRVALHPVKHNGQYIAGTAADAERHKPR